MIEINWRDIGFGILVTMPHATLGWLAGHHNDNTYFLGNVVWFFISGFIVSLMYSWIFPDEKTEYEWSDFPEDDDE